jgi:L-fuconolactonase
MSVRIDAHQHFWVYRAAEYPWIDGRMAPLRRDFLPVHLQAELARSGVDASIAVQAAPTAGETEWLLELAGANRFIAGVVGWVDLCAEDVHDRLARLCAKPKLLGVRHLVQDEPDDRFMLRPDFQRGLAALGELGLTYDLLIHPRHLPVAAELAGAFDSQRFILDHLAKPPVRSGAIAAWAKDLARLAAAPNVWVKLSGLVTEADWVEWTPGDIHPYLDVAFDLFGAGRLLAGSDWPVCTLAADYARTMSVVTDYLERRPRADRDAVLGENAQRLWRLDTQAGTGAHAQERMA